MVEVSFTKLILDKTGETKKRKEKKCIILVCTKYLIMIIALTSDKVILADQHEKEKAQTSERRSSCSLMPRVNALKSSKFNPTYPHQKSYLGGMSRLESTEEGRHRSCDLLSQGKALPGFLHTELPHQKNWIAERTNGGEMHTCIFQLLVFLRDGRTKPYEDTQFRG